MKPNAVLIVGVISLFLFLRSFVFAETLITVGNVPLSVDQTQEFGVDISLVCTGCSDSFLRGVFYPGGTSYFGYTQNDTGGWVNVSGANCTQYYKITSDALSKEGTWSGKLRLRPDAESSLYNGPGEYILKVGRYTGSCGTPKWSSEHTVVITGPTTVPTLAPSPTIAPAVTSVPTATPAPQPTNTVKQTLTISAVATSVKVSSISADANDLLGVYVSASASQESQWAVDEMTQGATPVSTSIVKPFIISLLFTSAGFALLSFYFLWQKSRQ